MNKQRILISTIIPSYNRANTVGETIDSILAQQVEADMEIVIGDDCSTDNAREVLLAYKEKSPDIIRLIFHEQNMGLGANWATCVKACRGKYICNCDNDDYWHNPNKLQLQLDYMESHPESNILITNHRTHNRSTDEIHECKADIDVLPVSTATFGIETVSITRPDTVERLAKRYEGDREVCRYLGELFPEKFPFTDEDWDRYAAGRLVAKAYDVNDFESAKFYSKQRPTGLSLLKKCCARHEWSFNMFIRMRTQFRHIKSEIKAFLKP